MTVVLLMTFLVGSCFGAATATSTILGLAYWHRRTLRREQRLFKSGRLALSLEIARSSAMPKRLEVRA